MRPRRLRRSVPSPVVHQPVADHAAPSGAMRPARRGSSIRCRSWRDVHLHDVRVALVGEVPDVLEDRRLRQDLVHRATSGTRAARTAAASAPPRVSPRHTWCDAGSRRRSPTWSTTGRSAPAAAHQRTDAAPSSTMSEKGLARKSSAPASSARASCSGPDRAVSIRIGVQSPASRDAGRTGRRRSPQAASRRRTMRVVRVLRGEPLAVRRRRGRHRRHTPPPPNRGAGAAASCLSSSTTRIRTSAASHGPAAPTLKVG